MKEVPITCYYDANWINPVPERLKSVSGGVVLLGNFPIQWWSQRQSTVADSVYKAEFSAAKTALENVKNIRVDLMMLGVSVTRPSAFIGDNQSVVLSSSDKNVNLSKKHVAIAYHNVRAAVHNKVIDPWWIPGRDNPADMFTKPLSPIDLKRHKKVLFNSHLAERYIALKQ